MASRRLLFVSVVGRRLLSSSVEFPKEPVWSVLENLPKAEAVNKSGITAETIQHLETLSLLRNPEEKGKSPSDDEDFIKKQVETLAGSVRLAQQLESVNTDGVQPMTSLLEHRPMHLRDDDNIGKTSVEDVISNAKYTMENYFVAPVSRKAAADHACLQEQLSERAVTGR